MMKENENKKHHIIYCEQVLKAAEREAEQDSIRLIDQFKNSRKHRFRQLNDQYDEDQFDKFEEDLLKQIDMLEDGLMGVEMKLKDVLETATNDFRERVRFIIEAMKNKTTAYIKEVVNEVELFYGQLRAYAVALQEQFDAEYN
mmetsp:Transcript_27396/g.20546  ORF Transcript_27396/g.20546 Transcript_27396/m.20546 type:complete len:143 (+) Transcript_27396:908-1336(+)